MLKEILRQKMISRRGGVTSSILSQARPVMKDTQGVVPQNPNSVNLAKQDVDDIFSSMMKEEKKVEK